MAQAEQLFAAETGPDMTILDAADAMERNHWNRLLVRDASKVVGVLTEQDIVEKVLARGRRPDLVRVADVMTEGAIDRAGALHLATLTFEDVAHEDPFTLEIFEGDCEECGLFSLELNERGGIAVCSDCQRPAA